MTDEEVIKKYKTARTKARKARVVADAAFAWGMFEDEVKDFLEREKSRS